MGHLTFTSQFSSALHNAWLYLYKCSAKLIAAGRQNSRSESRNIVTGINFVKYLISHKNKTFARFMRVVIWRSSYREGTIR